MPALILPLVFIVAFWVFYVLPQQRRIQAHRRFVAALQPGDEVVTTAGIYATVTAVEGDDVTVSIADGVEIRMARLAISQSAVEPEPDVEPEPEVTEPEQADHESAEGTDQ